MLSVPGWGALLPSLLRAAEWAQQDQSYSSALSPLLQQQGWARRLSRFPLRVLTLLPRPSFRQDQRGSPGVREASWDPLGGASLRVLAPSKPVFPSYPLKACH